MICKDSTFHPGGGHVSLASQKGQATLRIPVAETPLLRGVTERNWQDLPSFLGSSTAALGVARLGLLPSQASLSPSLTSSLVVVASN